MEHFTARKQLLRIHDAMTERARSGMAILATTGSVVVPAIKRIQWLTAPWMTIEVLVSPRGSAISHSVALAAFCGDSAIELFSAAVVLWRFHSVLVKAEPTAAKITGWLLFALAIFISCQSFYTLLGRGPKPQPSFLGIGLLLVAGLFMPWLGRRKREIAAAANSVSITVRRCSKFGMRLHIIEHSERDLRNKAARRHQRRYCVKSYPRIRSDAFHTA